MNPRTLRLPDPRPDLAEDSELWQELLGICHRRYGQNTELFEILRGMRCCGLRIKQGQTGYVLRPEIGDHGFMDMAEYETMRDKYLVPYKQQIAEMLIILKKERELVE